MLERKEETREDVIAKAGSRRGASLGRCCTRDLSKSSARGSGNLVTRVLPSGRWWDTVKRQSDCERDGGGGVWSRKCLKDVGWGEEERNKWVAAGRHKEDKFHRKGFNRIWITGRAGFTV